MAATIITVNNNRFALPTRSDDIWNERKEEGTRSISGDIFHILLKETAQHDEQDRPVFALSEKVAVNYAALIFNEQPGKHPNPVLAAYKKFVDANPKHFLRLDELGDVHNKYSKGLALLHGQWVIFEQPKLEFVQPRLCAMLSQKDNVYLPGRTISSLADLDQLHKSYAVMYHAPLFGGAYNIQALFQEADIEVARKKGLPIANLNRPILRHIDAATLGYSDAGLVLRDDAGTSHIVPGTVMRDAGMVHIMQFGLVRNLDKKSYVGFFSDLSRGSSPVMLTASELYANGQNYSEQIYTLSDALFQSGAWQRGSLALAKRMGRWAVSRVKQALRPGNGN